MRFSLLSRLIILASLIALWSSPALGVDINQGMMLANSCAACHGTDGKSPGSMPSINGKSFKFIANALKEFRDGKRPSTVMGRHAKGYTDGEISLIAEHFSKLN